MGKRKGKEFIFWVDLECTGSGDDEDILEIGTVITDRELNELDARQIVLPVDEEKFNNMSDVVVKMHTDNGLLDDVLQRGFYPSPMHRDLELAQIDEELARWVRSFAGGDHMPIGGSGVSHYDRKYIRRDLPLLDKRITYKHLDIGVARGFAERAGLEWPNFHLSKSHRALDDIRQHVEEARAFLRYLERAKKVIGKYILP